MTSLVAIVMAALAGAILGSFAAAAAYRLPRGEDIVLARSACPQCGARLKPFDLVPILSFFWIRRRCRACGAAISWRYPAIEFAAALFCAIAIAWLGPTLDGWLVVALVPWLMIAAVSDLEAGIIPDAATAMAVIIGIVSAWWHDAIFWRLDGAAFGLLLGFGLRWLFRRLRGVDGLGLGDVKFFGAAGLWIGLDGMPFFFLLAGLLGLGLAALRRGMGPRIPFGPALALALYLMALSPRIAHSLG